LAFRDALGSDISDLPQALMIMWDDARAQADEAYVDYGFTMMPLGRFSFERSTHEFGTNPWPSGVQSNRIDLERFNRKYRQPAANS
tara:strand:+ start:273 stop:530 length:258 start_codon:yes stop_codon:yes gene_type:complete